jgi:hypothetical protein
MPAPSGTIDRQVDPENASVTLLVKVMMKRCILPRYVVLVGQLLEPDDEAFGQVLAVALIGGVAEIDATSEGTRTTRPATILGILPWAGLSLIQRTLRLGRATEQESQLQGRNEKHVPVFLKTTTTAAQLADRTETRHLGVELVIQSAKLGVRFG